ncbi:MAG TPA: peptidylprolyl isomerase [Polyangiaceae bacterium]|nr:peptidylprolyl isomerase [Polyangiaceae bacterium]
MLRFFRSQGVGQIVVGGVVVAIILVFALEFRTGRGSPTGSMQTECAVEYDGYCVDQKEYQAALALVAPRIEPKQAKKMQLRKRVLDGLAERELLVAAAKREGLGVSDATLDEELGTGRAHVSLPAESAVEYAGMLGLCRGGGGMYAQGCEPGTEIGVRQLRVKRTPEEGFDYKIYEREVRLLTNRGPKEFREMQEREVLAARMRQLVQSRVRVSESEAFLLFERANSRAVIRSVALEQSWFAKFAVDQSDAAVNAWAASNQAQVDEAWKADQPKVTAGCPMVHELMVNVDPMATDDEKKAARDKLLAAKERITKGESFDSVAREMSQAPSAALGGRIACLHDGYGLGAAELIKAAGALKEKELSDVIETPRGLHVLELDGKLDAAKVASEGRLASARNLYVRFAADEAMKKYADQLIELVKSGNKLETATEELSATFAKKAEKKPAPGAKAKEQTPPALNADDKPKFAISPPFSASGNPLPDLIPREPIATRAFELEKADDVYAKPIATATGLVVLQLKEKMQAQREEFEKEKWPLLNALRQAKASEATARYVADLRRAAADKLVVKEVFAEEPKISGDGQ